jgi:hypothetical protein
MNNHERSFVKERRLCKLPIICMSVCAYQLIAGNPVGRGANALQIAIQYMRYVFSVTLT